MACPIRQLDPWNRRNPKQLMVKVEQNSAGTKERHSQNSFDIESRCLPIIRHIEAENWIFTTEFKSSKATSGGVNFSTLTSSPLNATPVVCPIDSPN